MCPGSTATHLGRNQGSTAPHRTNKGYAMFQIGLKSLHYARRRYVTVHYLTIHMQLHIIPYTVITHNFNNNSRNVFIQKHQGAVLQSLLLVHPSSSPPPAPLAAPGRRRASWARSQAGGARRTSWQPLQLPLWPSGRDVGKHQQPENI